MSIVYEILRTRNPYEIGRINLNITDWSIFQFFKF